jgi:hypothetical protein
MSVHYTHGERDEVAAEVEPLQRIGLGLWSSIGELETPETERRTAAEERALTSDDQRGHEGRVIRRERNGQIYTHRDGGAGRHSRSRSQKEFSKESEVVDPAASHNTCY